MCYRRIVFTHSYLLVCVRVATDAWSKIKMRDTLLSEKRSVQAEELLSL